MEFQAMLENCLTCDNILVMSNNKIGKYKKPLAIFIKKNNLNGTERTINDIIDQLTLYFKTVPTHFYYKTGEIKSYIDLNTKLRILTTIWIN